MTEILLSKSAGFCFGVKRAVDTVEKLLSDGKSVATLGELIHNPSYLDSLKKRGVRIVRDVSELRDGETLVIRAHGVEKCKLDYMKDHNIDYVDATCPFVSKIAKIVDENTSEDSVLLIAGDENHPEVIGFRSFSHGESFVFDSAESLRKIISEKNYFAEKRVVVVAQTTFNVDEFEKIQKILKKDLKNALIFGTICDATHKRQNDAENLSERCDTMIVVGGKNSSNTKKLKAVCEKNAQTYLIESADELNSDWFAGKQKVGITAGASTPVYLIEEVVSKMNEEIKNAPNGADESFTDLMEEYLQRMNSDQQVEGTVIRVTPTEIQVDIGRKQAGFVPLDEYSSDPKADPAKEVRPGDTLKLIIMKTNDAEGTVMLSKKRYDSQANWENVAKAMETKEVLEGVVAEVLNKGVIVFVDGVRVFIPASQATLGRSEKLEDLLGKQVKFRLIDVDNKRKRAVGSINDVTKEERKAAKDAFWAQAEVGQQYTGKVVSLTDFGAFVEIAPGVHGLCHKTELTWDRVKHPSQVVSEGDEITVTIKALDVEAKKISLTYKKIEDSPWEVFKRDYPVGTVVNVQIVSLTTFGAFARITPRIQGLIHISQLADHRIDKPQDVVKIGDKVDAMITAVDFDKKHVSLSVRALLEPEQTEDEPEEDVEDDEIPEGTAISLDDLMAQAEPQE